jgi:hypothetical protein
MRDIFIKLLTGQDAFSNELTLNQIVFMVTVKSELTDIPKFVLPSARELRTACFEGRTRRSATLRWHRGPTQGNETQSDVESEVIETLDVCERDRRIVKV